MSEGCDSFVLPTKKGHPMDEFAAFIDHEAGFDCDPYDVEAYYAEQVLAYWD
jgi:hypothetical protein